MGDFYTEQLVKRQKASSTTLIKAILIILTVLSVVLIFMIPFGIIGPVIMMAPSGSPELRPYQGLKGTDYSSGMPGADTYELIVVNNGEKKKIIFEPNKAVCEGLKMLAPRKVFCK